MDADLLAATAGVLLSLAFSYIPGAAEWYQALTPTGRRLLMLGLLVCAALGIFLLACSGYADLFNLALTCDERSAAGLLRALLVALTANQGAFLISPKPGDRAAHLARTSAGKGA